MKILISQIFILLLVSFCSSPVFCQQTKLQQDLIAELRLTDMQQKKLSDIFIKQQKDISFYQKTEQGTAFREKRRGTYVNLMNSIEIMLDVTQLSKFKVWRRKFNASNAKRAIILEKEGADKQLVLDAKLGVTE